MPDLRVDNAQRAEVLDLLNRALEEEGLALAEYDRRVAAVATAATPSDLAAQVRDLPAEYGWRPHAAVPPVAPRPSDGSYGRTALVFGVVSVPLSLCLVGAVTGVLAILYSRRGAGARGFGAAMIGRVLGIIGVVLSIGAAMAMGYAFTHSAGR
jgi:hypothetical protein